MVPVVLGNSFKKSQIGFNYRKKIHLAEYIQIRAPNQLPSEAKRRFSKKKRE
jgi:hypothetical protein